MLRTRELPIAAGYGLLLALVIAACEGGPEPIGGPESPATTSAPEVVAAPAQPAAAIILPTPARTGDEELAAELVKNSGWINSEPFTLESQRGKVVLVDFWTYSCINCIRTFPYLKEWHEKYAPHGLVMVGVHTPEFEFEEKRENVLAAARSHGLQYPITLDNEEGTWDAYNNRAWPAKYLIDRDGYVRYTHFGEGAYLETEQKIRELLVETGADLGGVEPHLQLPRKFDPVAFTGDPATTLTRELYTGFRRNSGVLFAGGRPYVFDDEIFRIADDRSAPWTEYLYQDPGDYENNVIYLQGLWRNGAESITHARETEEFEDYIAIRFYATDVNVVMSSKSGAPYEVRVTMDGRPLAPGQGGADITFDEDGNSYVPVDESRMYRVVQIPEFSDHELNLSSNSPDFSVFAFTFGAFTRE